MIKIKHTICPSCSLGCGISIIRKNEEIVGTYPYKRHPVNEGKNCIKGRHCFETINSENRLNNPLIKNGSLVKGNWDDALELISNQLNSYTPEDIGFIGSGKCTVKECETLKKFANALDVKNIGFYADNFPYFEFPTGNLDDLENAKFILVIGDVFKENPLMGRRIIKAKEKGAHITSIDSSTKSITIKNSHEHLKINSIKDLLDQICLLSDQLDESSVVVVNKLDCNTDLDKINRITVQSGAKLIPVLKDCNTRGAMQYIPPLNKGELKNLIEGVKILVVMGADPASYASDSLKKLDFLISVNTVISPTTRMSDVALPGMSWAEKEGSYINTTGEIQHFSKVTSPPVNSRGDGTIIMEIAGKMGIEL